MSGNDDMMDHEDPITDDLDASEEFFEEGSFEPGEVEEDPEDAEDWESYDGEFTTDEGEGADSPAVKKKKSTNLIIIGGALLVGFGILLMTLANNKPAPQVTGANNGALPGVTDNAPKFSSSKSIEVGKQAPAGLLNDPEALKNLPKTIEEAAVSNAVNNVPVVPQVNPDAPVAAVGAPAPAPASTPASTPAEPVAVPAPDAVAPPMPASSMPAQPAPAQQSADALTPMPVAQPAEGGLTAPMPEQPQAQAAQPEAPIAAAPAEPAPQAAAPAEPAKGGFTVAPVMTNAAGDQALDAKLNQLLDRMNAVETKLADVQKQPSGDLQAVQQTLTQISSRLDRIEAQAASAATVAQPAPAAAEPAAEQPAAAKPRKTPHAAAAAPAPRQAKKPAEKTAVRWVLKSAQPGQAYVSRPGQADMVSVHVGDTLPGIGRVTTIDASGGRWVIHGTQGEVSQ